MSAVLTIKQLAKTYKNGVKALDEISLSVERGDFFALLGPNGAGKSTLIGILTSIVNKDSGQIIVDDHDVDIAFAKAKSCIGVVPQEINLNVFEQPFNILVDQAGFYGIPRKIAKARAEKYLRELDLWGYRKKMVYGLSGGMKRRLMIARALVHEPVLLILDEPTVGVDIEIRQNVWRFLRELNASGVTILLTTHYLEEAEALCRNVAIINHGKIVTATPLSSLLRELHFESFILDLDKQYDQLPDISGVTMQPLDGQSIEVGINKGLTLNMLFNELNRHNITVTSMRNKSSRLEQLLMRLTHDGET